MAKKAEAENFDKPVFDPSQYFNDEDAEGAPEGVDLGDDFDPEADDREDDPDVIETEEEPEDDAEEEPEDDAEEEPEDDAEEEPEAETEDDADEPEDDAEAETEEEAPVDKQRGKPNHMIPKRRLDTEIAKRRQMEQELKQARDEIAAARKEAAEKAKVPDDQINSWLKEASDKALEGDSETAAKLHKQALDAMAQNRGEALQGQQPLDPEALVAQIEERVELKHTVKEVFQDYPMLDPNNDSFDESLNEEAIEFQDFYMAKGYTPAVAVEKAVAALAATHGLASTRAEAQPPAKKPIRDTTPKVKEKLAAAKKQPPQPATRKGNRATAEETVDLSQLDDEQLMALPESVRSRLRGD